MKDCRYVAYDAANGEYEALPLYPTRTNLYERSN